jgi:hypothetical protein
MAILIRKVVLFPGEIRRVRNWQQPGLRSHRRMRAAYGRKAEFGGLVPRQPLLPTDGTQARRPGARLRAPGPRSRAPAEVLHPNDITQGMLDDYKRRRKLTDL